MWDRFGNGELSLLMWGTAMASANNATRPLSFLSYRWGPEAVALRSSSRPSPHIHLALWTESTPSRLHISWFFNICFITMSTFFLPGFSLFFLGLSDPPWHPHYNCKPEGIASTFIMIWNHPWDRSPTPIPKGIIPFLFTLDIVSDVHLLLGTMGFYSPPCRRCDVLNPVSPEYEALVWGSRSKQHSSSVARDLPRLYPRNWWARWALAQSSSHRRSSGGHYLLNVYVLPPGRQYSTSKVGAIPLHILLFYSSTVQQFLCTFGSREWSSITECATWAHPSEGLAFANCGSGPPPLLKRVSSIDV